MPAGRPTKYTTALIGKAKEYLSVYNAVEDKEDTPDEVIPSHVGLAKYLDITTTCMYNWAKHEDKKEFSDILAKILAEQHLVLINMGLSGKFNSNITKLVLGKHGYHEKHDTKVEGSLGLTDMSSDELDRKIKHLESLRDQGLSD